MVRFLFSNLNKSDIHGFVSHVARAADADVVILAEVSFSISRLLESINDEKPHYHYAWGTCGHLLFITRFDPVFLKPILESHRISIRSLKLPGRESILLAAAHLPSKLSFSEESQVFEADGWPIQVSFAWVGFSLYEQETAHWSNEARMRHPYFFPLPSNRRSLRQAQGRLFNCASDRLARYASREKPCGRFARDDEVTIWGAGY